MFSVRQYLSNGIYIAFVGQVRPASSLRNALGQTLPLTGRFGCEISIHSCNVQELLPDLKWMTSFQPFGQDPRICQNWGSVSSLMPITPSSGAVMLKCGRHVSFAEGMFVPNFIPIAPSWPIHFNWTHNFCAQTPLSNDILVTKTKTKTRNIR